MKPICHSNRTTDTTETINVDDEWACLVDNSDESASGGAECMLVSFFVLDIMTNVIFQN